ncbi:tRNA (adenosine(37)-N6)-threonylcarbamoyltransferase complex ATPase subunit type 1 TsaE [Spirobacillus cienkowskii]|uniref:tRNA (adenosine(37)-N6)-threonylcarbamoyltransferase complex ATPase subunit type 1 TsaE n=1 Tax=Spirobacillus cienkowskii TaxID=495820 RepID=UPI0030CE8ACE
MLDKKFISSNIFNILNSNNNFNFTIEIELSELHILAESIIPCLLPGDWIFLDGDLGSGKTALTKQLSIALGAESFSTSPTFSILNTETLNKEKSILDKSINLNKLIHLDLYRLKSGKELNFLGLEDEFNLSSSICIIEWPYNIDESDYENFFKLTKCPKPKRILEISIELTEDPLIRSYAFKKTEI